jgi:hypothetical protein
MGDACGAYWEEQKCIEFWWEVHIEDLGLDEG